MPGFSFLSWLPFKILLSLIMLLAGFRLGWKEEGFSEAGLKFLKILKGISRHHLCTRRRILRPLLFPRHRHSGNKRRVSDKGFSGKNNLHIHSAFDSPLPLALALLQLRINHNKLVYPVEVRLEMMFWWWMPFWIPAMP